MSTHGNLITCMVFLLVEVINECYCSCRPDTVTKLTHRFTAVNGTGNKRESSFSTDSHQTSNIKHDGHENGSSDGKLHLQSKYIKSQQNTALYKNIQDSGPVDTQDHSIIVAKNVSSYTGNDRNACQDQKTEEWQHQEPVQNGENRGEAANKDARASLCVTDNRHHTTFCDFRNQKVTDNSIPRTDGNYVNSDCGRQETENTEPCTYAERVPTPIPATSDSKYLRKKDGITRFDDLRSETDAGHTLVNLRDRDSSSESKSCVKSVSTSSQPQTRGGAQTQTSIATEKKTSGKVSCESLCVTNSSVLITEGISYTAPHSTCRNLSLNLSLWVYVQPILAFSQAVCKKVCQKTSDGPRFPPPSPTVSYNHIGGCLCVTEIFLGTI